MKLTKAQRWCLDAASKGRCVPAGMREIHVSFGSGETWYGVPRRTLDWCRGQGLVGGPDNRITDAGRKALEGGDG